MRTVYKWPISDVRDEIVLDMPEGAEVLTFRMQYDVPTLWALVDPEAEIVPRHFRLAGTGHPIDEDELGYIGSVQLMDMEFHGERQQLVFHLFEVRR